MDNIQAIKEQYLADQSFTEDKRKLVSFHIGSEEFAIDITMVHEIFKLVDITLVPKAPYYVEGVINLRGRVIPIINIRKRLGLPVRSYDKDTKIVVVEINKKILGFIVDAVSEVIEISSTTIEPPPSIMGEVDSEFISGVGKLNDRLLVLLDLEKVLTQKNK
ncbi:MAG: chemotaxis protein CheW [Candidatus Delongbacteria bacterium]|nr:chemotaxis protein CheW [Candidatus Delongbacteria bacterium]